LVFGGNVFGWTADESTSFKLLDAFVAAGFNSIDTADVYSRWAPGNRGGESESIIGKWLKKSGNRNKVVIATKAGKEMGPGKKGLSKKYICLAVEDSLQRLQTDYIDLYQAHFIDPRTPIEETLSAFSDLVRKGYVRYIGCSNFSAWRLMQALWASDKHGYESFVSIQPEYSLVSPVRANFERELAAVSLRYGIGVLPYSPLAGGFLTGKYRRNQDLPSGVRVEGNKQRLSEKNLPDR